MNFMRLPLSLLFSVLLLVWIPAASSAEETQADVAVQQVISVNVNTASATELAEKLNGIGPVRAEMIVKYREENGPFTSLEQLLEVRGFGTATLEKNRDRIQL